MKVAAVLLALSATLVSAWEFDPGRGRIYRMDRDSGCEQVGRHEKNTYRWDTERGTDPNAKCCVYLYEDSQCGRGRAIATERNCRGFSGISRRPYDSFQVICNRRDSFD